jgi:PAS domain S-box-containing protein
MALTLWSLIGSRSKAREAAERATVELRASLAFQEHLLTGAPYATISAKLDGTVTLFNQAAERLLGYTAEEVVEKEKVQLFLRGHVADTLGIEGEGREQKALQAYLAKVASTPGEEYDWVFTRKDGTTFPGRLSLALVQDPNEKVTGMVGMVRNIEVERRAQEAESRLAAIVDTSGDAIFSVDNAGLFTTWNRGAEELLGYTNDEAIGMPAILIVPEEEREQAIEIRRAMQQGETLRYERLASWGEETGPGICARPVT